MKELTIKIIESTIINEGDTVIHPLDNFRYRISRVYTKLNPETVYVDIEPTASYGSSNNPFPLSMKQLADENYILIRQRDIEKQKMHK